MRASQLSIVELRSILLRDKPINIFFKFFIFFCVFLNSFHSCIKFYLKHNIFSFKVCIFQSKFIIFSYKFSSCYFVNTTKRWFDIKNFSSTISDHLSIGQFFHLSLPLTINSWFCFQLINFCYKFSIFFSQVVQLIFSRFNCNYLPFMICSVSTFKRTIFTSATSLRTIISKKRFITFFAFSITSVGFKAYTPFGFYHCYYPPTTDNYYLRTLRTRRLLKEIWCKHLNMANRLISLILSIALLVSKGGSGYMGSSIQGSQFLSIIKIHYSIFKELVKPNRDIQPSKNYYNPRLYQLSVVGG